MGSNVIRWGEVRIGIISNSEFFVIDEATGICFALSSSVLKFEYYKVFLPRIYVFTIAVLLKTT